MKYGFIARHQPIWPVRTMCQMLDVSPAGFYEWRGRGPSKRSLEDARLTGLIRTSFLASDSTYGSPRIWRDLYEWGERCGKKRVARLMGAALLGARPKQRSTHQTGYALLATALSPFVQITPYPGTAIGTVACQETRTDQPGEPGILQAAFARATAAPFIEARR